MATKIQKTETVTDSSETLVPVYLPLLEEDKPGTVDQTVVVKVEGKNHNNPFIIQRGQHVQIPVWAFEVLAHSGRFSNL